MHVLDYLGRPWVRGQYDCWALVRDVYRHELHIDLPVVPIDAEDTRLVLKEFQNNKARGLFDFVERPTEFCVVGMTRAGSDRVVHCGVFFTDGQGQPKILHNVSGTGVVCQRPTDLAMRGLKIQGYYQYAKDRAFQKRL